MKKLITSFLALFLLVAPSVAQADSITDSTVGVQGYDLVSYHSGKPLPGNGNHVVSYKGTNYLFSSAANKDSFSKSPAKYLPAYGGWCAFGVSVGKKFISDPNVWEIVDGTLYLNLDNKVKGLWGKDIPGNISKADKQWMDIHNKKPSDL